MVTENAAKPAEANEPLRRSFVKVIAFSFRAVSITSCVFFAKAQSLKKQALTLIDLSVFTAITGLAASLFHNDRSTFGFADGHAEKHRWLDGDTIRNAGGESNAPNPGRDIAWIAARYIPGKR